MNLAMAKGRTRSEVPLAAAQPEAEGPARPRFAIHGHYLIAIPHEEWKRSRHAEGRAAGFLELDGIFYDLIERPEFEGVAEGASPISSMLTSRELQIVYSVADGKCDKVIAHDLGISEYTVREHMRRVFHKLNVSKRAVVVARLIKSRFGFPSSQE
jgi:DNA-binding CsgD family transcriptional regulator